MKRFCIFFLVLIIANQGFSQHSHKAYVTLADSLYKHHNYQEAANYYQRAIKKSKEPGNIMLKVARAYTEINNVKEAEPWFEKAKVNNAVFSKEDTYHFVKALIMLQRRKEAEVILQDFIERDPNALYARQLLDDLQNTGKYFSDSSAFLVTPLSINTPVAEFAPEFYKDGIVFTSAQPQFISKKKYHWDNTFFLNLYYSVRNSDQHFQKPVEFDKEINTRFHDGPVAFYANDERMILNRNQQVKLSGKVDIFMSHLVLLDVSRDLEKKTWIFTPLPFENPPYSFAHPHISEDGNTLYFISDMPGGYGGTDVYRSLRSNDKWSVPFNLGPSINTSENESFPFFVDHTLYFSSDGHGGLGGLDIFKSTLSVNGFAPPVNLGYPINSHVDDFSLITKDHQTGYFSSARSGNDDLFEFHRSPEVVKMIARIYDATTKESLPGASIQLITTSGDDMSLTSGNGGNLQFELPREAAYILIATKEGKTGLLSSLAIAEEDYRHIIHQVPAYGDTTVIPCIGSIKNESGLAQNVSAVTIIDETTGKKTIHSKELSLVSFLGQKGHTYRVEIQNEQGDTAVHKLEIKANETGHKTWSMVFKEIPAAITLSARIFDAATNAPLSRATVRIITLAEPDQELTADENGVVDFLLPADAAYIVVASQGELVGIHSDIAERATGKNFVVHPIPARKESLPIVPVVAMVTNSKGEILQGAKATITNKATGEQIPGKIENGMLSFFGKQGQEYNINIEHEGHQPTWEEISIAGNATSVKKISVVLQDIKPAAYVMAARIIREVDKLPVAGANVRIITFSEPDRELIANNDGLVEFTLPEGEGYIVVGTRDGLTGMHMGVAEKGADKTSVVHPVPVNNDPQSMLEIFGMVRDESGAAIMHANVEVTDTQTGEPVPAKIENGILSFRGKRGSKYSVKVSAENYAAQEKTIPIDSTASVVSPLVIDLNKKLPVTAKIANKKGEILQDATVVVIDKTTGEKIPAELKNGVMTLISEQGKQYDIIVTHQDHQTITEELIVPQQAKTVDQLYISLEEKISQQEVVSQILDESGKLVTQAQVEVTDNATGQKIDSKLENGVLSFIAKKGADYKIDVKAEGYHPQAKNFSIDPTASGAQPLEIKLQENKSELPVTSLIADESGNLVMQAQVEVTDNGTGQKIDSKLENGVLSFIAKKGSDYKIDVKAEGYHPGSKSISIEPAATKGQPVEIKLESIKAVSYIIAARVVKASDDSALAGAEVKVMSFASSDMELVADKDGVVEFIFQEGSAYIAVASKDGNFGMYSGIAEKGEDKIAITHPIPVTITPDKQVPVLAFIADETGVPVTVLEILVTDKATGEKVETKIENGILFFYGRKGGNYKIDVKAEHYHSESKDFAIDSTAYAAQPLEIKLQTNKTELPVTSLIADDSGKPVTQAQVEVTDIATGQRVDAKLENGILTFAGRNGVDYRIDVKAEGYHPESKSFRIDPAASTTQPLEIKLQTNKTELPVTSLVADESGKPVTQAQVEVTDNSTGQKLEAKIENGILSFIGKRGGDYKIDVKAEGYYPESKNVSLDPVASATQPLEIKLQTNKTELQITSLIADESGKRITEAQVEVIDNATGKEVNAKIENGQLTFNGKKGGAYTVRVRAEGYEQKERSVNVAPTATSIQSLEIKLEAIKAVQYVMAARVVKGADDSALGGAEVKIMSFASADIELVADDNGVVEFTLPEGSAYIAVASKDGNFGMHSGIAEKGEDKIAITHRIQATVIPDKQLPVLALIADEKGIPVTAREIVVTDKATGEKTETKIENGILFFYGKKGSEYKIEIVTADYETQSENIKVPSDASVMEPLEIVVTRKKLLALSPASRLIVINNEVPKFYVTSGDSHEEIVEKDGALYLRNKDEMKLMGNGKLSALFESPSSLIQMTDNQLVDLQNIYFDYNSALLDQTDKEELDKVKKVIGSYPLLQLKVNAHADLRGSAKYNLRLTRKRARSIKRYLVQQGIRSRTVVTRAYGKSAPAVVCETAECTEQQHQKNRRAEFELAASRRVKLEPLPVVKPQPVLVKSTARTRISASYARLLARYGDRQLDDLVFKVCIGAYRNNSRLTFSEFTDLGKVENQLSGSIYYYYLHGFQTLKAAENIRQHVIARGISDAYIVIFYKGEKILFVKFISLTN